VLRERRREVKKEIIFLSSLLSLIFHCAHASNVLHFAHLTIFALTSSRPPTTRCAGPQKHFERVRPQPLPSLHSKQLHTTKEPRQSIKFRLPSKKPKNVSEIKPGVQLAESPSPTDKDSQLTQNESHKTDKDSEKATETQTVGGEGSESKSQTISTEKPSTATDTDKATDTTKKETPPEAITPSGAAKSEQTPVAEEKTQQPSETTPQSAPAEDTATKQATEEPTKEEDALSRLKSRKAPPAPEAMQKMGEVVHKYILSLSQFKDYAMTRFGKSKPKVEYEWDEEKGELYVKEDKDAARTRGKWKGGMRTALTRKQYDWNSKDYFQRLKYEVRLLHSLVCF